MLPFWLSELTDCGVDNSMVVKGSRKECVLRRISGDQGERCHALDWGRGLG